MSTRKNVLVGPGGRVLGAQEGTRPRTHTPSSAWGSSVRLRWAPGLKLGVAAALRGSSLDDRPSVCQPRPVRPHRNR